MRILLDECVHVGVKAAFPGHAVKSVSETAWLSGKDGPLLAYAQEQFDVFVTIDRKLEHQHNLKELKLGFVFARVPSHRIEAYHPISADLQKAAATFKPGEVNGDSNIEAARPVIPVAERSDSSLRRRLSPDGCPEGTTKGCF